MRLRWAYPFLLTFVSLFSGCGRPEPGAANSAAFVSGGAQPAAKSAAPATEGNAQQHLGIEVSAAGEEKGKLEAALATVDGLFASPELWKDFATVAAQYPRIYVGPEYRQQGLAAGMADATGAASFLRSPGAQFHTFQAILGLTGTYYNKGTDYVGTCSQPGGKSISCRGTEIRQNYSNELVVTHGIGLILPSSRELASIEVGREVFDRYNSPSTARKSCTYNTLAHEWTHTIGKNQERHWAIVVDTDAPVPGNIPKLSYLFGSVAQCSWLQGQGAIGAQDSDLRACVVKFGTDRFNSLQCS